MYAIQPIKVCPEYQGMVPIFSAGLSGASGLRPQAISRKPTLALNTL